MRYVIEVDKEIRHIIDWIKDYFIKNGPNSKAVIGMSGGKDSTIAAALLVQALGAGKVHGVIMPDGEMKDQWLAEEICKRLGINYEIVNIGNAMNAFYDALLEDSSVVHNVRGNPTITTNSPARMRMMALYAVAAEVGGRVVNTCNHSEDYVGFSTKYGDLAGDFSIFKNYPVRWVKEIGYELVERGIINIGWVNKIPDDGMCGYSDEKKFGFTYETLDAYLIDKIVPEYETMKKIHEMHERNKHKECINLPAPYIKTRHRDDEEYTEQPLFQLIV